MKKTFTKKNFTAKQQYVGKFDAVIGNVTMTIASGKYLAEMAHLDETPFNAWLRGREIEPVMKISQNAWFCDYRGTVDAMTASGLL